MSQPDPAIQASYAFCRRVARGARSSFYPCFRLLGPLKRRAMDALYAFMHHTDDLADSREPLPMRRDALARWRTSLETTLSGELDLALPDPPSPAPNRLGGDRPGEGLLPALADTVRRFAVPPEHLLAVIDGVQMDLDGRCYETFDELVIYCERVASAVGLACIHIWGFSSQQALEPARKCGIAFQITNILRDLKEDADRGRVYLPAEDLRTYGYSADELGAGVADDRFLKLMSFEIDRARRLYREGTGLFEWLEPDGRRVFGMMTAIYYRLLEQIARSPKEVFTRRVHLGPLRKLGIVARWLLLPPRRSALP